MNGHNYEEVGELSASWGYVAEEDDGRHYHLDLCRPCLECLECPEGLVAKIAAEIQNHRFGQQLSIINEESRVQMEALCP